MSLKRIVFIVMCLLLAIVIVMSGIVISKVSQLAGGMDITLGGTQPSATPGESTQSTTEPVQTQTQPTVSTTPTVPETTVPTEPEHVHDYVLTDTMEANCENYGYKIYTCTTCGKQNIPNEEMVEPYGHNFGAGQMFEATCTEDGYTRYTCARCGMEEDRNIKPALGHAMELIATAVASCGQEGYDLYACTACGLEEKRNVIPGGEHNYVLVESADPGCTAEGYEKYFCDLCQTENVVTIPAAGHDWGEWITQEDGSIVRICRVCSQSQSSLEMTQIATRVSVEDGEAYRIYIVTVGTAEMPEILHYTIYDHRNGDAPTYRFDPVQGLVVTYINAAGVQEQRVIPLLSTEPLVLTGG